MNAFLTITGIETLALRMERHCANAMKVAEFLQGHPAVAWVNYAGLPSSPYHELARKYMPKGAGSVFTFGLKGGFEAGVAMVEGVELFSHLANIGDTRSLIIHPASTTHRQLSEEGLQAAGATADVVRLSIGIESAEDIIADLDQALKKAASVYSALTAGAASGGAITAAAGLPFFLRQQQGRQEGGRGESRQHQEQPVEIGAPAIGQRHQLHAQRRHAERQDELGAERQPLVPVRRVAGQQQVFRRDLKALREHHQGSHHQQRKAREAGRDQQQRDLDQQAEDIDPLQRIAVRQHAADELRAAGEQIDQRHQPADAERAFPDQPGHPLAEPFGHRGHGRLEDQAGADHRHGQHDEGADRVAPVGAGLLFQIARAVGDHAR